MRIQIVMIYHADIQFISDVNLTKSMLYFIETKALLSETEIWKSSANKYYKPRFHG